MFNIYHKSGASSVSEKISTGNPVEAEAHYFRLCKNNMGKSGSVIVESTLPSMVAPGDYKTDNLWPGNREQVEKRHKQIWATPETGWTGATPFQAEGLKNATGAGSTEMGKIIKKGDDIGGGGFAVSANTRLRLPWESWSSLMRKMR